METHSFGFPLQNETFKLISLKIAIKDERQQSRVKKKKKLKIFIFQRDIIRLQSLKTPLGLHVVGGK